MTPNGATHGDGEQTENGETAAFRVGGKRTQFSKRERHRCDDCGEHEPQRGDTADVSGDDWHDYGRLCSECITRHDPPSDNSGEDATNADELDAVDVVDPYPNHDTEEVDTTPL